MSKYNFELMEAKIKETGWPMDGRSVTLSLWDYDNRRAFHLYDWPDSADKDVMETMFITETQAGICLHDTLEEFSEHWEEWEPQGSFLIPLGCAEILKYIYLDQEEEP